MLGVLCRSKNGLQGIFFVIILITLLGFGSTHSATSAYARITSTHHKLATCSNPAAPTSQSVLVVLLDRSGSLHSSDPDGYSTSVTKALADLWPGIMIVIPYHNRRWAFSNDYFPEGNESGSKGSNRDKADQQFQPAMSPCECLRITDPT